MLLDGFLILLKQAVMCLCALLPGNIYWHVAHFLYILYTTVRIYPVIFNTWSTYTGFILATDQHFKNLTNYTERIVLQIKFIFLKNLLLEKNSGISYIVAEILQQF